MTRQSMLTLHGQRSPELGIPGENPNLGSTRGLVVTGFVDRVGDPVGMVAPDGSMHRGELLVADALRELLYTVTGGRPPAQPAVVTHPAHRPQAAVDSLRTALTHVPQWSRTRQPITVVSDAAAAISALQSDPGVPARGVIALCDFGGTGTSITLLDASRGYAPLGPTVRHTDFSGDLIDQALLTHVVADLSPAVAADATGTSALGPLHRLRAQCGAAKERLSGTTVTALTAELPGFSGEVRLTRTELDEQIRRPLAEFVRVLQDTLDRAGVHLVDLAAVASTGGGARIPIVTTTLSERFRVPVISTPRPELAAASGAALRAAWGPADDRSTAIAPAAAALATVAALAFADADGQSQLRSGRWRDLRRMTCRRSRRPSNRRTSWSWIRPRPACPAPPATGVRRRRGTADRSGRRRGIGAVPRSSGIGASAPCCSSTGAVVAFGSTPACVEHLAAGTSTTARPRGSGGSSPDGAPAGPEEQDPAPAHGVRHADPATQYQAPAPQQAAPQPAAPQPAAAPAAGGARPPAPSSDVPPPPTPETTTVTTEPPPTFTTTVTAPPVDSPAAGVAAHHAGAAPAPPPSSTQPRVTLTIPSIPGLLNPPHSR